MIDFDFIDTTTDKKVRLKLNIDIIEDNRLDRLDRYGMIEVNKYLPIYI